MPIKSDAYMYRFEAREQREIKWCRTYYEAFNHGTDGHHKLRVIAQLSEMLESVCRIVEEEERNAAGIQSRNIAIGQRVSFLARSWQGGPGVTKVADNG